MSTATDTERTADTIRSAAAWWKLAAERLESGNVDEAIAFAKLGRFGVDGMVERIEALTQP
jgi:hypothetical protein